MLVSRMTVTLKLKQKNVESNLPIPYQFFKTESEYYFYTENGIKYTAYFNRQYGIESCPVFEFGFSKNNVQKSKLDLRVRETIKHILLDFWNNYDNVILFVCDSSDGRSAARMRLFNKWYCELNTDNNIIKIDFAVEEILASLLSKRENCLLPFAEEELKQLFSLMQE